MYREDSFAGVVSSKKPFGLSTDVDVDQSNGFGKVFVYASGTIGYLPRKVIPSNCEWTDKYKVLISYAYGAGARGKNFLIR